MRFNHGLKVDEVTLGSFRIAVANTWSQRFQGLLRLSALPSQHGLWIVPCSSIHTFHLRFRLDLIFLDAQGYVVRQCFNVPPNRFRWAFGAHSVIEFQQGEAPIIDGGQRVCILKLGGSDGLAN